MLNVMLAATGTEAGTLSAFAPLLMMVGMLVIMYLLMIRPQRKREKEQRDMRNSIEVGDGVTTIGGIVGRVVSIKEDTLVIETGAERNKIRFQKWAVQEVEKLNLNAPAKEEKKEEKK